MQDSQEVIEQDVIEQDETTTGHVQIEIPPSPLNYFRVSLNLFREAWPFLATRSIELGVDFAGAIMLSNLDKETLAATSLITSSQVVLKSINATFLYYTGVLTSQAKARGELDKVGSILKHSWIFAAGLSVPSILLAVFSSDLLHAIGLPKVTTDITQDYLRPFAIGIPVTLMLVSSQQVALGLGKPLLVLGVTALTRPITLFLSYSLVYGKFNMPKLGVAGLAHANTIGSACGFLAFHGAFSLMRSCKIPSAAIAKQFSILLQLVKQGIPIGIYAGVELGTLLFSNILIGRMGKQALAPTPAALQYSSILANATYTLSATTGILMAREVTNKQLLNARRYSDINTLLCTALPAITAVVFLASDDLMLKPFHDIKSYEQQILVKTAHNLMLINLLGQIVDGIRNASTGSLRGLADTNSSMFINLLATFLINVPMACIGSFSFNYGSEWIFSSRSLGIAIGAALTYFAYVRKIDNRISLETTHRNEYEDLDISSNELTRTQTNIQMESEHEVNGRWSSKISTWCCLFRSSSKSEETQTLLAVDRDEQTDALIREFKQRKQKRSTVCCAIS